MTPSEKVIVKCWKRWAAKAEPGAVTADIDVIVAQTLDLDPNRVFQIFKDYIEMDFYKKSLMG